MTRLSLAALPFLLLTALNAQAGLYKVVGADGKISYTDQKPLAQSAKAEKLDTRTYAATPMAARNENAAVAEKVTLFTAKSCQLCDEAKAYMASRRITYQEWDVDKSNYARAKLAEFGADSVPVILVGREKMVGFSEARLDAMLNKARGN